MNATRVVKQVVSLAIFLWAAANASAKSDLSIQISDVDFTGGSSSGYSVFYELDTVQTVYFTVKNNGGPQKYFVTFSSGQSSSSQRQMDNDNNLLDYQLYDSESRRSVLRDIPAASAGEVISGSFSGGEDQQQLSFVAVIPARQVRFAGKYHDKITVTLYEGTLTDFTKQDSQKIDISIRVMETAELCLVDSGASFDRNSSKRDINFGNLEQGKTSEFDLRVRSNAGYKVSIDSDNNGVLKHTDPSEKTVVPYEMRIDGSPINLSKGKDTSLARKDRVTDANGDAHAVTIVIGNTDDAVEGTYRDNITVTVAPL